MAKGKKDKKSKGKKEKKPKVPDKSEEEAKKKALRMKKYLYDHTHKLGDDIRFKCHEIEDEALLIMKKHLEDKEYHPVDVNHYCQQIADEITDLINSKRYKHFKHVVLVSIGSMAGRPGIYLGTKCLWNEKTDSYTTLRFQNKSLYAICLIYGLFYE